MSDDPHSVRPYVDLIDAFLANRLSPAEFASKYLDAFKTDDALRPDRLFLVLDRLFADADTYLADLDDDDLRTAAVEARAELERHTA